MSPMRDQEITTPSTDVAIIGMACRLPGSRNIETFWDNLCNGVEGITFLNTEELEVSAVDPADTRSTDYVRAAALLEDADKFDAAFFGYSPTEAELMDPQQRLFIECAWHALEDAGYDPSNSGAATGVFAGARTNTYLFNIFSNANVRTRHSAFEVGLANDLSFLSSRVSYKLNLHGPSYSIQSACSTSLVAVHLACRSLLTGECDMALAGAASVNVPQRTGYLAHRGGILSQDGHCRAFDEQASGTIFGSGIGVVVLKLLSDAITDRDHVYAVIKGSATNNDGAIKASFTAPSVYGQREVIDRALAVADISADTISYVEAHGTGTHLGDPIEIRALTHAFRRFTNRNGFCALGSVKTNLGHLDAAAGMAGLIKTALALHHKKIPPTLHFQTPNPQIDFAATPFYANTTLREWDSNSHPRRAAVSAFGIGGANAHIILEEAPVSTTATEQGRGWQIIPLSARSNTALEAMTSDLGRWLERHDEVELADVAHTLHHGRKIFASRRIYLSRDKKELLHMIRSPQPDPSWSRVEERSDRPIVLLFPGQGARCLNAGRQLYDQEPLFRKWMDSCSQVVEESTGWDLRELIYPTPERSTAAKESLERTEFAQPALFSIEYSLARLWMEWGVQPAAMVGHSLGEYVAATLSGVFSFDAALRLVVARGHLMQGTEPGVMFALSLDETQTKKCIEGTDFDLAAVNGPRSCVVAGPIGSTRSFEDHIRAAGVPHVRLQTSRAFHSRVLAPILQEFAAIVGSIPLSPPRLPFISNLTGTWITSEQATSADYWMRHARQTVRFMDGMIALDTQDKPILLEVGPGNTLQKLAASCLNGFPRENLLTSVASFTDLGPKSLLTTWGQMWLAGANLQKQQLYPRNERTRIPLPGYPFDRTRYWIESQYDQRSEVSTRKGKTDTHNWFFAPGWRLAPPHSSRRSGGSLRWLLLMDDQGMGKALSAALRGEQEEVFEAYADPAFEAIGRDELQFAIADTASFDRLLNELPQDEKAFHIVHLCTLSGEDDVQADHNELVQRGYYSLLRLLKSLVARGKTNTQVTIVTDHLFQAAWNDKIYPAKALLAGLAIVAPQEVPELKIRCIDITLADSPSSDLRLMADELLRELTDETENRNVTLRGSLRWTRKYDRVALDVQTATRPLRHGGVYLITGGFGSVGRIIASYLARQFQATLILTTRSPLPPREQWNDSLVDRSDGAFLRERIELVKSLETEGAKILVASVDISSEPEMSALIHTIQSTFGSLHGVVHAAGVTSGDSLYRSFTDIDSAESEAQFGPKVIATQVLKRVLQGVELDFCLLLSSNASTLGGLGYSAYAAANAYLDAFSLERARHGEPWISASWDPWPKNTKKYQNLQTGMDRYAMTVAEAEDAFHRVVTGALPGHLLVVTGDMDLRLERSNPVGTEKKERPTSHPRPTMSTEYIVPETEIEKTLASIWKELLGIETVGTNDNFFELGGHSLLAMHVMSKIRDEFQIELPMTRLFEEPTIASLAALLAATQDDADGDSRREILDFLNAISDEEAEAEILKRVEL